MNLNSGEVDAVSGKDYRDLDDYIDYIKLEGRGRDVETRSINNNNVNKSAIRESGGSGGGGGVGGDIYSQLAQKEKDLILAAELGKALLERNEELTRANEKITEDYSHQLEFLEQEKHGLRRRLDTMEGEYEGRISELQSDITTLQRELGDHQSFVRQTEKEKSQVVQELLEQNHRLTRELKEASDSEDQLSNQLQSLREQFNARRSNLHDHVAQLEGLREEINILGKRKSDLEKRISALSEEREHLSMSLEESSDRILMLEKHNQDMENRITTQHKDLEELRHANSQLQNKLESCLRKSPATGAGTGFPSLLTPSNSPGNQLHTSLYNEIEMSSSSSIEDELRSLNGRPFNDSQFDEIECDDPDLPFPVSHHSSGDSNEESQWKLRQEIIEIYQQLRRLCQDLHRRRDNSGIFISTADSGIPTTPEEIQNNQIRAGMLTAVLKEFKSLFNDMFAEDEGPCLACRSVAIERAELEKLRKQVAEKGEEGKRKGEEICELTRKLTILEAELGAAREERDNMRETVDTNGMGKDEIVKRAWELRDQAVARKNTVEIELAKTRIEVMHINGQLMEAIQQKIELSQQLEQWQVDMQSLLDEQLKKKLTTQEQEEKRRLIDAQSPNSTSSNGSSVSTGLAAGLVTRSKLLRLWR